MRNINLYKKVKKIILLFLLGLIGLFAIVLIVFAVNKDKISSNLLLKTNKLTTGEVTFSDIWLTPFANFPHISLLISEVKFYDKKLPLRDSSDIPVCDFNKIYIGINILDLLYNEIDISNIIIEDGFFNIIHISDSSYNITEIFPKHEHHADSIKKDTAKVQFNLSLDKIELSNVNINYIDKIAKNRESVFINNLSSSLMITKDTIAASFKGKADFKNIPVFKDVTVDKIETDFNSSIFINKKLHTVTVSQSNIKLDVSQFIISGFVDFNNKYINVKFESLNEDMNLFKLFLKENSLPQLKHGKAYLNGHIKGYYKENIPEITSKFGIKNLELLMPEINDSIKDLNIFGYFSTGKKADLSEGVLKIDSVYGGLPDGKIYGNIKIQNFKYPNINSNIYLKTNLSGFDKVFKINKIKNLNGIIELNSKVKGKIVNKKNFFQNIKSITGISLYNISFVTDTGMVFKNISGNFFYNSDTACINNLSCIIGNSDFLINGTAYNISSMLINNNKYAIADLQINSSLFDLTDFLNYRYNIGKGFPYQASDLSLNVTAKTNKEEFKTKTHIPHINFDITGLSCLVNKMLPPVTIKHLNFDLGTKDELLYLSFTNFDAIFDAGKLSGNVVYAQKSLDESYVSVNANIERFNLGKFFVPSKTTPELLYGALSGDTFCKLTFNSDINIMFDSVEFTMPNLIYKTDSGNFEIKNFRINAGDVSYDNYYIKNPLATLTTDMVISAGNFHNKNVNINNLSYKINADNGAYTIVPNVVNEAGKIFITPFASNKNFDIDYKISNIKIKDIFKSFNSEVFIDGSVNIATKLTGNLNDTKNILKTVKGNVFINGNELFLYGINLDEFLKRVERSQNFTFADLGAVLLMGPLGIVVTKGTDYTRVLMTNTKDTTHIRQIVSDWTINGKGKYKISDVALSTDNNLIAAKGYLDLKNDSINFTFAVVDNKGCKMLSQKIKGNMKKPDISEIKIISSAIIAPVTNLFKDVNSSNCKPFYKGKVKYPQKKTYKENKDN